MAAEAGGELGWARCPAWEGRGVPVDMCLQWGRPSKERAAQACPDVLGGHSSEPRRETTEASESVKGGHATGRGGEAKMGGASGETWGEAGLGLDSG